MLTTAERIGCMECWRFLAAKHADESRRCREGELLGFAVHYQYLARQYSEEARNVLFYLIATQQHTHLTSPHKSRTMAE